MKKQVLFVALVTLVTAAACERTPTVSPGPPNSAVVETPMPPEAEPALSRHQDPPGVTVPVPERPPAVVTIHPTIAFDPPEAQTVGTIRVTKFDLDVGGLEGEHEVAVQAMTPSGHTYQLLRQGLYGAGTGSIRVSFELPVAGTFIDSSNLSGRWAARILLDGMEQSAVNFELAP